MPLAEARSICKALRAAQAEPSADARLLGDVADWCDRYTPLVALDPPAGLLLDVAGCADLFGGEEALACDLTEALAARGLGARVAVAGAAGAARALARFSAGGVVPPGEDMAWTSKLPVAALGVGADVVLGLVRAGLTTLGAVAARGPREIAARFGAGLVAALDEALGRVDAPISPLRPAPARLVERRFAEPVTRLDAALAALRALAGALGRRLELAGEGLRVAEAAFFRTDGVVTRVTVGMGAPTRDPEMLLRLFRERLDALADPLDPGFGYDLMRLSALEVEPLVPRAARFDARDAAEGEVSGLIDRLTARHGRRRVLRFTARDAHRPEAEAQAAPAQGLTPALVWTTTRPEGEPPRRPLRMFAAPEPIDVLAEVPDGPPLRFLWRRAAHRVVRAEGPERIAPEWWLSDAPPRTRDYFRVEDEAGARFWLYRDGLFAREALHPRWFLHGLFA